MDSFNEVYFATDMNIQNSAVSWPMWVLLPAYNPQRAYKMCKEVKTVPEIVRIAAHMEIRCKETAILMPVLNCNVMSSYWN